MQNSGRSCSPFGRLPSVASAVPALAFSYQVASPAGRFVLRSSRGVKRPEGAGRDLRPGAHPDETAVALSSSAGREASSRYAFPVAVAHSERVVE